MKLPDKTHFLSTRNIPLWAGLMDTIEVVDGAEPRARRHLALAEVPTMVARRIQATGRPPNWPSPREHCTQERGGRP